MACKGCGYNIDDAFLYSVKKKGGEQERGKCIDSPSQLIAIFGQCALLGEDTSFVHKDVNAVMFSLHFLSKISDICQGREVTSVCAEVGPCLSTLAALLLHSCKLSCVSACRKY